MRYYITRLLKEQYDVVGVSNGRAALEEIRQRAPDLILSDVMMPLVDGFALLRELRSKAVTKNIPIIFLSARTCEKSRAEGFQQGVDDYLIKPFSDHELTAMVQSQLE